MTRPLLVLSRVYLAALALLLALLVLGMREPGTVALLAAFLPFLFAPLGVTVIAGLALHSRTVLAGSIGLLIVFALLYGPLFLPKPVAPRSSPAATIKVMTFNLGPGVATEEGIVAAIRREEPDIVGLQEAEPPAAARLRAELEGLYPFMVLTPETHTSGLLSRFPILEVQWLPPGRAVRSPLHAVLDWRGQRISAVVAHPAPPGISKLGETPIPIGLDDAAQQQQLTGVARWVETVQGTMVVMGDFNQNDQSQGYIELSRVLKDAYREAGQGFGFTFPVGLRLGRFPVPGPVLRLDYIFHSPDLVARHASVRCDSSSDHCYVVAELEAR